MTFRREFGELFFEHSAFIEEFFRPVAFHPSFENPDVLGLVHIAHRHLMASPVVLTLFPIDLGRAGPTLGGAQNDHWPGRTALEALFARFAPDPLYVTCDRVERRRHRAVHLRRLVSFDEIWLIPVAFEQLPEFFFGDSREKAGVGNLVAIEVQNRQNATVALRIEKLVAVPSGCERACFCLAISDYASDYQIRIVKGGAVSMRERISKLTTFMNGAWCLGCDMAGNTAWKAELLEEALHSLFVL